MRARWIPGLITVGVLAGCASTGSTTSTPPAAQASSTAPQAAAASPSEPVCTTRSCIAGDIQRSLVGLVAEDEAVATKASCKPSTVKHNAGDTWTARCTVTYSDGSAATGFGNLLPAQQKVTFQPDGT